MKITQGMIKNYQNYLINEEKASATVEKYVRDVTAFMIWANNRTLEKQLVLAYKDFLMRNYAGASVNSIISSLNSFFSYMEWYFLRVKTIKIQRQIFANKEKELTKSEYMRLLYAARSKGNRRLMLVMQTICSAGIRVSELRYITVDAVKSHTAIIRCKGKMRQVFLPAKLCSALSKYIAHENINSGAVFITKSGKSIDRSNIWSDMKALCEMAGVAKEKVFPHNLRHLFARTYYSVQKDIVRLADILGHSSVNTTRIYTMETGEIHRQQIQRLGLLLC